VPVPVDIAELERRARRLLTPEVYDYYAGGAGSERTLMSLAGQATSVTFADIGWLARLGVPVLVKGVLRPDDARAWIDAGAAGVIVSNHGGRQLDRAVPTALALPGVAAELARGPQGAASGGAGQVYADGGLRTGEDVLTALGLGRTRCSSAAPYYGPSPVVAPTASGIC
jgi:isopentenyl diphosphate isomerase/L-lactate dehydrogenase-like FMN-dependent dehydrogenase